MRMMEKLFTTSNFPCIIMEKEENLSSILKPRRAVKNQSWATGWKTGLLLHGQNDFRAEGTEFVNSNYDDLKSVYTIWICMDTKKSEDSIIEFGMKSSLIYGKIKKIPQIDKLNVH